MAILRKRIQGSYCQLVKLLTRLAGINKLTESFATNVRRGLPGLI